MKLSKMKQALIAVTMFGMAASSQASLIENGVLDTNGGGLGNVKTVLTLDNNRDGTGTGSVTREGGADKTNGDAKKGASQSLTRSFGSLNITQADQLQFVFNASEPGKASTNGIVLEDLVFSIYSDEGGVPLYTTSLFKDSITYAGTESGIGNFGYVFVLDAASLIAAQNFISATNRIGLAASVSGADGGLETFFVSLVEGGGGGNDLPEPGSIALLGLGMVGMSALRRRYHKR